VGGAQVQVIIQKDLRGEVASLAASRASFSSLQHKQNTKKMAFSLGSPSSSADLSTPTAPRASLSSAAVSFGQAFANLQSSS
jgi:hypothetical protein